MPALFRRVSTAVSSNGSAGNGEAAAQGADKVRKDLLDAITWGDTDTAMGIIKKNPRIVNKDLDQEKRSALHIAAFHKHPNLVRLLLAETGADVARKDQAGNTAVHAACEGGDVATLKTLVDSAVEKSMISSPFAKASSQSEKKAISSENSKRIVNMANKHGRYPIHVAVMRNDVALVSKLLEYGCKAASTKFYDQDGEDPLLLAAKHNFTDVLMLLWQRIKDKDFAMLHRDKTGNSCLHYAALNNNPQIANILLSANCAASALKLKNKDGDIPARVAALKGFNDLHDMLQNWQRGYLHVVVPEPDEQAEHQPPPPCPASRLASDAYSNYASSLAGSSASGSHPTLSMYQPQITASSLDGSIASFHVAEACMSGSPGNDVSNAGAYGQTQPLYDSPQGRSSVVEVLGMQIPLLQGVQTGTSDGAVGHTESGEHPTGRDTEIEPMVPFEPTAPAIELAAMQDKIDKQRVTQMDLQQLIQQYQEEGAQLTQQVAEMHRLQGRNAALAAEVAQAGGLDSLQAHNDWLDSVATELPQLRLQVHRLQKEMAERTSVHDAHVAAVQDAHKVELQNERHLRDTLQQSSTQQLEALQVAAARELEAACKEAYQKAAIAHEAARQAEEKYNEAVASTSKIASFILANLDGRSLVVWACETSDASLLRFVLEAGCRADEENEAGSSGLHVAAQHGSTECAEWLLKANANVDKQNKAGDTPLHVACMNGHADIARMLLDAGAAVHLQNQAGDTALHAACRCGQHSIITMLLSYGATADVPNQVGITPLQDAATKSSFDILGMLLDAQPALAVDLLFLACTLPNVKLAQWLFLKQRDLLVQAVNTQKDGNAPLQLACKTGDTKLVQLLIAAGADMNAKDKRDMTPLMVAAECKQWQIIKILMPKPTTTPKPVALGEAPPKELECPITHSLMMNPYVAPDECVYERDALRDWLAIEETSPMDRRPMSFADCKPVRLIKQMVQEWLEQHPDYQIEQ